MIFSMRHNAIESYFSITLRMENALMIVSISKFNSVFSGNKFDLPIRWDGKNFVDFLKKIYEEYVYSICSNNEDSCKLVTEIEGCSLHDKCIIATNCDCENIKQICNDILEVVNEYLCGFPAEAYKKFEKTMQILFKNPLKIYKKSGWSAAFDYGDPLHLFRVVNVSEDINHHRTRVFHTPFTLRSKVSTSRYSIAGFPSLYLGTCIDLCMEEIHNNPYSNYAICSRFELIRDLVQTDTEIDVIELGIKPQDFFVDIDKSNDYYDFVNHRKINIDLLQSKTVKKAYLLWYPLIAACSFIRANKQDPFAPEYIIPQLLMQWIRKHYNGNRLMGIRYFSCSSERASDLGFNYVFPTSGKPCDSTPYCSVLSKSFKLTNPIFIHEFNDTNDCQKFLISDKDLKTILQ